MPAASSFTDLVVWQKAHALALAVFALAGQLPRREERGLSAQMRRAALSVPGNIAEGFKRFSRADKARMLNIAQGSLEELRSYLRLAADLGFEVEPHLASDADEVARLLDAYRRKILVSRTGS
jgi:four helix bundle protein